MRLRAESSVKEFPASPSPLPTHPGGWPCSCVVGRGKWPGLIELFGAVLTADPSRHTRRPAVMPPAARIATHMCSKREPFSATKVRQTIRSFTHHRRGWAFGHTVNVDDQLYSRVGFATNTDHSTPAATRPCQSIRLPSEPRENRPALRLPR